MMVHTPSPARLIAASENCLLMSPVSPVSPLVRFAPSPTGRLHIGNIRTAVLNWLFALKHEGAVILRMDDTDRERSTEAFAEGIREDLTWLGLKWQREERQSARIGRYAAAAEILRAQGRLYACYETAEELERKRRLQLARGLPPLYDRAGLRLSADERRRFEAEGRRPHWRFRLANTSSLEHHEPSPTPVSWADLIRGHQTVDAGSLSDPVLVREDGTFLYTFTSVVDDSDFGVTHVIRGEDHVTNTAVQIGLFEALGATPPAFAHHSLFVGPQGEALSKRLGALSVAGLREAGLEPMAIVSHAALSGTSDPVEPYVSLTALAARFEFTKISTSPTRFDIEDLKVLNARLLHLLPYEAVAERLAAAGVGGGAAFWEAVKGNLTTFADAQDWWRVVSAELIPVCENLALTAEAAELLPPEPWDEGTWAAWTRAITEKTGAKGRTLFHALRLALTGAAQGPELKRLLPFIGRERAEARLLGRPA